MQILALKTHSKGNSSSAIRKIQHWVMVTFAILGVLIMLLFLQDKKSFGDPKFRAGIVTSKHVEVSGCSNLQTSRKRN
jgi:hypothetical protein